MKHDLPVNLLELYKCPAINRVSVLCEITNQIASGYDFEGAYHQIKKSAPSRHARNKRYFVGHNGMTSSGEKSNRREEHLAVALWNATQEVEAMVMPGGSKLRFLDYQFPLKAFQGNKGIGKVDLFGVIDDSQPCVVELKIHPIGKGRSDTPLRAFLEALAYCAVVQANANDISREAFDYFGIEFNSGQPLLMLMAPEEYWLGFRDHKKTGDWWPELQNLSDRVAGNLGVKSHFLALKNSDFSMGLNGQEPRLNEQCSLVHVADLF